MAKIQIPTIGNSNIVGAMIVITLPLCSCYHIFYGCNNYRVQARIDCFFSFFQPIGNQTELCFQKGVEIILGLHLRLIQKKNNKNYKESYLFSA